MTLYILWFILIILGLRAPSSKIVTAVMLTFLVIAIGLRTQGADYDNYQNEYLWSTAGMYDGAHYPGYVYLQMFSHGQGFDLATHLFMCALISSILYIVGISRLTKNRNLVLALFLVYPFGHEAIQVRSFLADSIVLCVLPLLLREKVTSKQKKIDYVLFFGISAIAATIHYLVVFYIACAVLYLVVPKRYGTKSLIFIVLLLYILILSGVLPSLLEPLNSRIAYWLSLRTRFGAAIPIGFTVGIWGLMKYMVRMLDGKSNGLVKNNILVSNIGRYCDYSILLIPFFAYDITFNRLWRLFLILMFVCYATLLQSGTKKIQKNGMALHARHMTLTTPTAKKIQKNGMALHARHMTLTTLLAKEIRKNIKVLLGIAILLLLVCIVIYEGDFVYMADIFVGNALIS